MKSQSVKPMLFSISSASWRTGDGDGASDQFPAGLRVLVVDDDSTCLRILDSMLKKCGYEVTQIHDAESALDLLRRNKNGYDIVMSDVHMPDMDGFKLMEHIGLEMDLPVIMMSADDSNDIVLKGITHGACDYLIKPISFEALKNIWQHVVRKKKQKSKEKDFEGSGISEDGEQPQKSAENFAYSSSADEANYKNMKRRKDKEDDEERDDTSTLKKPRVVWSTDLHQQFVNAVRQLGIDKAVPKKILELMSVPGLTRENVASHLQKFRLYLRRASQHQGGLNNTFMGLPDASSLGLIPLINDLHTHGSTGQIQAHSLATYQTTAHIRAPVQSLPLVDQRNPFCYGIQKLTPGDDQLELNDSAKQIHLFHGIHGTEPKQHSSLDQCGQSQSFGATMNMQGDSPSHIGQQIGQLQERTHIFDDQPNLLQGIPSGVHGARGTLVSNTCTPPGESFPLVGDSRTSCLTSQAMLQVGVNSEMKGSSGFVSSYEAFGALGNNSNTIGPANSFQADNIVRISGGRQPDMNFYNNSLAGHFTEEELVSALLKQEEGMEPVNNEFSFDEYHSNNLHLQ